MKMMWNGMGDWFGWSWLWPLHLVIPLVLLAVIVAAGVLLVRYLGGWTDNAGWRERRPTALELLEERYARDEINRDEFLERKRDIVR
jgi:putative membrane protein